MPPAASALDTIITHRTPEGIELQLSAAGPLSRGIAWLLDLLVRIILYLVLALILTWLDAIGFGLTLIGIFLIEWFYPVFFEMRNGMTPGKKALGLVVVNDDGTPVAWSASLLRNLIRPVDLLPLCYMTGLVTMVISTKFQRLGDLAAGTVVVYRLENKRIPAIRPASPQPPPTPLKLVEQRLILDYCERVDTLSDERRSELASLLPSLTGHGTPEEALLSFGNWYNKGKIRDEPESI